ncbi:methylenetetrahydrofolate--tRNA-(uracil(54)-C(5))-methyltransferase (FADH(2)-oxidizing) TrmFO [Ructibacterium gallinarum]|uniref:Methylenetetrahydrofolate--tRNA-(uracil-5-)-methyltransferase TrmFO n=1 Tax=Ructibacterium gallinarum TaxID=2779355 RepID=A0A9D5R8B1_9FIRM|nr:methylenetetrahydrofolate--tRNA-(uracil(54)-C(5))-methyltransferase (FADH(2)-oxidizing) TrmFO [Ructibacterium gallinarum]MBE5039279.1 methylenetetrahydrofolate--tRNA-(uracil(54)-C(5))-methyltransferase (FADH(2)-oxidizing) TrmFO [Ructibacterium gallinarum]
MELQIIGAGLAGCEAAWQAAEMGISIRLCEMKPVKFSPAHTLKSYAELVCSNSLRADGLHNAVGLLKEEMRRLHSLIMECADATRIPAGGALAVDRMGFSEMVTEKIKKHPNIRIEEGEVTRIDATCPVIIAAGPLVSDALAEEIKRLTGDQYLHFYDAAAPIVSFESIDMNKAFRAARYGKGGDDYINCPMDKEEYLAFYRALVHAETAAVHDGVEDPKVFEGCMPIEVMARRGEDTMRFGPLKPVGLTAPDGSRPYAVVQLRQDNAAGSMYNLVGFQTHLKFPEQKRVFSMIPGLEHAEFMRYGVMHRNTYINSPKLLTAQYRMRQNTNVYFAGQITGVEGYVESAASGMIAGIAAACALQGKKTPSLSSRTALGALGAYVSNESISRFQPMNINFGIMEPLPERIRDKKEKAEKIAARALAETEEFAAQLK